MPPVVPALVYRVVYSSNGDYVTIVAQFWHAGNDDVTDPVGFGQVGPDREHCSPPLLRALLRGSFTFALSFVFAIWEPRSGNASVNNV